MTLLTPYLKLESVRLDLNIASQKRLFEEASLAFERAYGVPHDEAFAALMERERIGSTAVGHGCAVPHGRLADLENPAIVFLRTLAPLRVSAPDNLGVQLFFAILVPAENPGDHLALLRETAGIFGDDKTREALLRAPDATSFLEILSQWSPGSESGKLS
ncbi:PTS sugar transporter subunit IIA [uncultured Sutterella sp.]|uniref:PTS sugar transporter subunit IIA n=1 Tax=uncultured Sutterella sp. TaxID=286133 RepID=UPI002624C5F8|nr:PTS sugar transporter subunit IIA [uncultured Sutterella sp.]